MISISQRGFLAMITGGYDSGQYMSKMRVAPALSMDAIKLATLFIGGMTMDLNNYDWDAYLANDHMLSDPDIVRVKKGSRVQLKKSNAASRNIKADFLPRSQ